MVESSVLATLSSSEEVAPSLTHSSRSISARRSGSDVPAGLEHRATAMAPLCPGAAITVAPVYPGGRGVAVGRNPLVSRSVAVASGVGKGVATGQSACVAVGTSLDDGCESETVLSAGKTYCPHAMSEVTITRAGRAIALATAPLHSRRRTQSENIWHSKRNTPLRLPISIRLRTFNTCFDLPATRLVIGPPAATLESGKRTEGYPFIGLFYTSRRRLQRRVL